MSEQAIRVLLVEDEVKFADLLQEVLAQISSCRFEVTHAKQFSEMLEQLSAKTHDVILLDLSLPGRQGLDTYAELKRLWPMMPTIILTGLDDEKLGVQAVRAGAQDYLVKGQFDGR